MAKVFSGDRIVPVWARAALELSSAPRRSAKNYVLEISHPRVVLPADVEALELVDAALRERGDGIGVGTVASTIFPNGLYRRFGRPRFYEAYKSAIKKGRGAGSWGTYALRMIDRIHPKTRDHYNPLDVIVEKLRDSRSGRHIRSAYELGVSAPYDLLPGNDGLELPIYDPSTDGRRPTNIPCLSHLSFKFDDERFVDLTAMYRSHHYAQRALGNLIGLSQLLTFVGREAGLETSSLTCLSTQAFLDVESFGGVRQSTQILERVAQLVID